MIIFIFMHIIIKYRSIFLWDFLTFEPAQRFFSIYDLFLMGNADSKQSARATRFPYRKWPFSSRSPPPG